MEYISSFIVFIHLALGGSALLENIEVGVGRTLVLDCTNLVDYADRIEWVVFNKTAQNSATLCVHDRCDRRPSCRYSRGPGIYEGYVRPWRFGELNITNVRLEYTNRYSCRSHFTGESKDFSVQVIAPPGDAPTVTLLPYPIIETASIRLQCITAPSTQGTLGYTWWKDGILKKENMTRNTLLFSSLSRDDSGFYTCGVTNVAGSAKSVPIALNVQFRPKVNLKEIYVRGENESVDLVCSSESYPVAQEKDYRWTKGGVNLPCGSTCRLTRLTREHAGLYTCTVSVESQGYGTLTGSSNTTLAIMFSPKSFSHTRSTKVVYSELYQTALLDITVSANPTQVKYTWYVENNGTANVIRETAENYRIMSYGIYSKLEIINVTLEDFTSYIVTADNKIQSGSAYEFLLSQRATCTDMQTSTSKSSSVVGDSNRERIVEGSAGGRIFGGFVGGLIIGAMILVLVFGFTLYRKQMLTTYLNLSRKCDTNQKERDHPGAIPESYENVSFTPDDTKASKDASSPLPEGETQEQDDYEGFNIVLQQTAPGVVQRAYHNPGYDRAKKPSDEDYDSVEIGATGDENKTYSHLSIRDNEHYYTDLKKQKN